MTGGTNGIGLALAEILFSHHAKIYVAARSKEKASERISGIKARHPTSTGELIFLSLVLDDLTTIKASAEEFLNQEKRLDVLWNNAGVMLSPEGSTTKQGVELQLGTNCLGPFLFTKLTTPLLIETARTAPKASVRVVWLASSAVERYSPQGGVDVNNLTYERPVGTGMNAKWYKYGTSKAGNVYYGSEFARRHKNTGVISVALDPGNLKTDLYQHLPKFQLAIASALVLKEPIFGAYTELYGGLSSDITPANNGSWVVPWGKIGELRKDVKEGTKSAAEGGSGVAEIFWDWSERQVVSFL